MYDLVESTALVSKLNREHGSDSVIFAVGRGNWPEILLKRSNGSSAVISLYGGHLLSWIDAKGRDIFYLSENATFSEGKAIRGGVPVIFPWFGKINETQLSHGFARNTFWSFESCEKSSETPSVTLVLSEDERTLAQWPHSFRLELTYTVGETLQIKAKLKNTSRQKFSAQFALHNYFATQSIHNVQVRGLESCEFLDKTRSGLSRGKEISKALKFVGLVDRIYLAVSKPVTIHGVGSYVLSLESDMPDRVAWNPGKVEGPKLADLGVNGFEKFICIESGAIENNIQLAPGAEWTATQLIELAK